MKKIIQFPSWPEVPDFVKVDILHQKTYLVNGVLKTWTGDFLDIHSAICIQEGAKISPALLGSCPSLDKKTALEALEAAVGSYDKGRGVWATATVKTRCDALSRFAKLMKENRTELTKWLVWEIGKSWTDSEKEVDRTLLYISDTIEALKNLDRESSRLKKEDSIYAQIRRGPLGVVLCMGPFNYPLNETFATLIPALIMGNSVILKPAKNGILLLHPLLEGFRDCFPAGVINVIYGHGEETVGPIMETGKIDVFAFIGSSKIANTLKKAHPRPNRLRSVLGLEAKNPAIVLPDSPIESTVNEIVMGTLSFNGQRCTALKIIFVHKQISKAFLDALSAKIKTLKMGMPWEAGVVVTPLPEKGKTNYLDNLVQDAISKGAKVLNENGGKTEHSFFYPALLFPVSKEMRIYNEEQFGPIIPVIEFEDISEPIDYMVDSPYGQQVSIFGNNSGEISGLIDQLVNQVCRVNINSQCQRGPDVYPFNGRKDSAEGTLSVTDALRVFSIRTMVAAKDNEQNRKVFETIIDSRLSNFLSTDYIL